MGGQEGSDERRGTVVTNQLEHAPYPASRVIMSVNWAPREDIRWEARGKKGKSRYDESDNWPIAWADDGHLYTADGYGFDPIIDVKLGLGFARIEGGADDFKGVNIRSASGENTGHGPNGKKASGMLMVGGVLYFSRETVQGGVDGLEDFRRECEVLLDQVRDFLDGGSLVLGRVRDPGGDCRKRREILEVVEEF